MVARSQAGFSLIELLIAIMMVAILASAAFQGESRELRHVAVAFAETKASRLAASWLEALRAARVPPATGELAFTPPVEASHGMNGVEARQRVVRLEDGLFEVEVEIRWMPVGAVRHRRFTLTTYMEWGS